MHSFYLEKRRDAKESRNESVEMWKGEIDHADWGEAIERPCSS